jgi:outer membrane protein OmpA-like peptidoglycan-associated protein
VISFRPFGHSGSATSLIGKKPSEELIHLFSNEEQITDYTPKAFIVHAADDKAVPIKNSLYYVEKLSDNNVAADLHVYAKGGHGFGLNNKTTKEQLGYFCTKNVVVLNILDYNAIIARREKQKQDGLIKRANDSLAAISKSNNKEIDKDFIKNAVANKGKDLNVSLNEGYDASKTKLDTTNLPNVSLNPIYFDLDKFAIRKDASKTMDKNIEIMKQYPDFVFKVSGFTDVRGGYEYNVILSKKRALAAISYLVKNGIPENRITGILSMGEKTAGFKDDTKTGLKEKEYQSDRRVEFSVLGKIIK